MNDEIKEILVLQNYINRYKSDEKAIINRSRLTTPLMLDYLEVKNLLDYITNLQQRCEYLERSNNRREDTIIGLRFEVAEQEDYKSRCEKAIKRLREEVSYYINNCTNQLVDDEWSNNAPLINDLLNILQNGGEDK